MLSSSLLSHGASLHLFSLSLDKRNERLFTFNDSVFCRWIHFIFTAGSICLFVDQMMHFDSASDWHSKTVVSFKLLLWYGRVFTARHLLIYLFIHFGQRVWKQCFARDFKFCWTMRPNFLNKISIMTNHNEVRTSNQKHEAKITWGSPNIFLIGKSNLPLLSEAFLRFEISFYKIRQLISTNILPKVEVCFNLVLADQINWMNIQLKTQSRSEQS